MVRSNSNPRIVGMLYLQHLDRHRKLSKMFGCDLGTGFVPLACDVGHGCLPRCLRPLRSRSLCRPLSFYALAMVFPHVHVKNHVEPAATSAQVSSLSHFVFGSSLHPSPSPYFSFALALACSHSMLSRWRFITKPRRTRALHCDRMLFVFPRRERPHMPHSCHAG